MRARRPPARCRDCNWPLTNRCADRCRDCYVRWLRGAAAAWEPVEDGPDWVVVDRLVEGIPVPSATREERKEAIARLEARGLGAEEIGRRVGVSGRTVQRRRAVPA